MNKRNNKSTSHQSMNLLSRLLLMQDDSMSCFSQLMAELESDVQNISRKDFNELVSLACSNHVVVRVLEAFMKITRKTDDDLRTEWAQIALRSEQMRISSAVDFLQEICLAFEARHFDVVVIKSLDHWPDLGSDLDLYTNANSADVFRLMTGEIGAKIGPRSWGDRLARKWNFFIPGLNEAVEIHMGLLGQTGEQSEIAAHLVARSQRIMLDGKSFRVPSASDRLMISTLQRMYRHFYFRLCDIVDTIELAEFGGIDYLDLRNSSKQAGIWEGVSTYLAIVSDYAMKYRGVCLDLPQFVTNGARFGGSEIYYNRDFLRVPILPQSASLYGSQLACLLRRREVQNCARLSLLPCLATAALLGQKITGSDKGIW